MTDGKKKLIIAAAVIAVITIAGTLLSRQIPEEVSEPLFILVVILEVVIAPIPGGAIGYLGAARFGFWEAWPLLYIGNIIGTSIVFVLARRYGAPLFDQNTTTKTRERYNRLLEGHPLLLWLFYAIPIVPTDVLSVLAGVSRMSPRKFLVIAFTGYFVYTGIVAYVGSSLAQFIGVTEALSVLGAFFAVALAAWLWASTKSKRASG